jgi:hypothetical protein
LAAPVLASVGEMPVFYRKPLHLRRAVRQTIEFVVAVGAAAFLSYLILQTRW